MTTNDGRKNIVIIGGGIIGCTTAYFLTRHPSFDPARHTITLLEASSQIAGGASGKAGGLLGLWAYPANLVALSYRLHAELAQEHGGEKRWGYRKVSVGQLEARGRPVGASTNGGVNSGANGKGDREKEAVSLQKRTQHALGLLRAAGVPKDLDWVAPDAVTAYDEMAGPDQTAQVHPRLFTTSMAQLAEEAGAKIVLGARVTAINPSGGGSANGGGVGSASVSTPAVESVSYTMSSSSSSEPGAAGEGETQIMPATHVVLAAGPWTSRLLPSAGISGLRAHSVTIRPTRPVSAYALFTHITLPPDSSRSSSSPKRRGQTVTPEIYARPDEIYACGEGDTLIPLPSTVDSVETDLSRCEAIISYVGSVSDELRDGEVTARQACYLPVCEGGGGPFIGEVREMRGLVLAAGHSCWGIQNGPGTGKVVSEIVLEGGARSLVLGALDPKKGL